MRSVKALTPKLSPLMQGHRNKAVVCVLGSHTLLKHQRSHELCSLKAKTTLSTAMSVLAASMSITPGGMDVSPHVPSASWTWSGLAVALSHGKT